MHFKKTRITPHVQPVDGTLLRSWDRDRLTRVRGLIQNALELIEASGQAPQTAEKVRAVLVDIDAMLAQSERDRQNRYRRQLCEG